MVSASSVEKDSETLPELDWRGGIPEYWLVDARKARLEFDIFRQESDGDRAVRKQGGWMKSRVSSPEKHPQFKQWLEAALKAGSERNPPE